MAINEQSTGLSNGTALAGMDPTQMGAIDPAALSSIPQVPETVPPAPVEELPEDTVKTDIRRFIESTNIAEDLDEEHLAKIASEVIEGFQTDYLSREDWACNVEEWTRLAGQVYEEKVYPWPKASNVKYPLISVAAMQFNARAYPSLIPSDGKIVKAKVIGKDPTGAKKEKADNISTYMSYQLLQEMHGWEAEMDKMLLMLPIIGTMFKKTYFDPIKKKNCSALILASDLVVNYWTSCLEDAERITEIIRMSPRKLKEKQLAKIFLDEDLGEPQANFEFELDNKIIEMIEPSQTDSTTPYILLEQHTFLDLNDDGYKEPYIVTVDLSTQKVLRIVARFDDDTVTTNEAGEVIQIDPIQYYTYYGFIPNPDGGFYSIGFGHLLGPLNEAVNSLINQLIDAGTLSNLQSGFIGKGLRMRMGETRLQPGEWRAVNGTGDDLKKQIVPLPAREPSNVLFQLMGALVSSGKELASVAEIFVGKMPGQNTPATTTMATIEQGMKVFTAVYKRIYRSLEAEFKKLFRLNEVYLNFDTYVDVLDTTVNPQDFSSKGYDICPGADPAAISQTEKLVKAQALMEILPLGTIDPMKVTVRLLEALEIPNWEDVVSPSAGQAQEQQPDPKLLELQMKQQAEQQKAQVKQAELQMKSELAARDQIFKQQMEEYKAKMDIALQRDKARAELASKTHMDNYYQAREQEKHQQKMKQAQEAHQQKQSQARSQKSQKPKSSTGKTTR